ncbi:MAG: acyltransferase [Planctomycetota bacterium]|nr:acyltransferase [Planctomycetota bacterium]
MARITRAALIQSSNALADDSNPQAQKDAMIEKHLVLLKQAAERGANVCCMQEIFSGPYFCAEQDTRWYALAESVPDGPTIKLMQDQAKKLGMVLIVPVYEEAMAGVLYNTAAVIDENGTFLGKYRKHHLPHCHPGFWEKFYFKPGDLGYPVFKTRFGRIGVYICYDRHFPEGARELGLAGAEIVFNPSATVSGLSEYLWKIEQPAHAVANQYFVGAINRVGTEAPWNIGEFYGQSYFCDPRGQIVAQASRDKDEVLVADLDLDLIKEVRNVWQFYRDRRPESYTTIASPIDHP